MPHAGITVNENSTVFKLCQLVASEIEKNPVEVDGHKWSALSERYLCDQLGISDRTIRRMTSKPPFDRTRARVDDKVRCLIRLGERDGLTRREICNIMFRAWERKMGRRPRRFEVGLINGLVDEWPANMAHVIFKFTLKHWGMFMIGVKSEAEEVRFLKWPSLAVLRRFQHIAVEMYAIQDQLHLHHAIPSDPEWPAKSIIDHSKGGP